MAKEVRDAKGNLVGIDTRGPGDTQVERDYKSPGGFGRSLMDVLGGSRSLVDMFTGDKPQPQPNKPTPKQKGESPVKVRKVDLAQPSTFKDGGTVKKTGWAKVHKGEKIMAVKDALAGDKEEKSKGKKKAKGKKSSKKKPHRLHVRGAANGGYIVEHEFKNDPKDAAPQENEEHQITSLDDLKDHIGEHAADMGGNSDEEEPQPAPPAAAAPAAGAPAPSMG